MSKPKAVTAQHFRCHPLMRLCLVACLTALVPIAGSSQQPGIADRAVRRITVGVLTARASARDSSSASSTRGVTLGIEEAQRTARLFGWDIGVLQPPDSLDAGDAMQFLTNARVTAIVGNLAGTLQTSRLRPGPLVLDIAKRRHRARSELCDGEFHLLPVLDSAGLAGGGKSAPPARYANLIAWDSSLERFGAAQLNDRYRRRFGAEMDEHAWAGWMSIKVLLDAVLRVRTTDPCTLARFLLSTDARFDGHKGVPLYFDPRTRELVQPLFAPRCSGEAEAVDIRAALDTVSRPNNVGASSCPTAC